MSMIEMRAIMKEKAFSGLRSDETGLDGIDAAILRELCADARIPRAELSRRV
ncbi:MAG: AsnC family transcriptional regulator, partial [Verrucomicrobiota bacterium]